MPPAKRTLPAKRTPPAKRTRNGKIQTPSKSTGPIDELTNNAVAYENESVDFHSHSSVKSSKILDKDQKEKISSAKSRRMEAMSPSSIDSVRERTDHNDQIQPLDILNIPENQGARNVIEENENQSSPQVSNVNEPPILSMLELDVVTEVNKIVVDNIENLQEKVFRRRENRRANFNIMHNFYIRCYPYEESYGRIYTRYKLAEVLSCACSSDPKDDNEDSMLRWGFQLWDDLVSKLKETRKCCLSNDANVNYYGTVKSDLYGTSKHESDSTFNKQFEKLIQLCRLNKAVAPIRIAMQRQRDDDENSYLVLDKPEVEIVFEMAAKLERNDSINVMRLFQNDGGKQAAQPSDASNIPELKPKEEIRSILDNEVSVFNLDKLQSHIEYLIQKWENKIYRHVPKPCLYRLGYLWNQDEEFVADDDVSGHQDNTRQVSVRQSPTAHLRKLKSPVLHDCNSSGSGRKKHSLHHVEQMCKDREVLLTQHGDDPIIESRELGKLAQSAQQPSESSTESQSLDGNHNSNIRKNGPSKTFLYGKKKSAAQLEFASDIECSTSSSSPIETDTIELSTPVKRRYNIVPKDWNDSLPPPDTGVFDDLGRVVNRRRWTDEEKAAVRHGFDQYGANWVLIKKSSAHILKNRTNVQIKDCYRTMKNHDEL